MFKALADPTRLRILNLLRVGDLCVCHLIEVLRLPQSTVSRHLAYLRRSGLVETWEDGTWNHYRMTKPGTGVHLAILRCLGTCLGEVDQLKREREALAGVRRAGEAAG